MMRLLKAPRITEKSGRLQETQNVYVFEVDMNACKSHVVNAVEKGFNVKVMSVRTLICRGKPKQMRTGLGRTPRWKKAYVRLEKGNKITLFEGV